LPFFLARNLMELHRCAGTGRIQFNFMQLKSCSWVGRGCQIFMQLGSCVCKFFCAAAAGAATFYYTTNLFLFQVSAANKKRKARISPRFPN